MVTNGKLPSHATLPLTTCTVNQTVSLSLCLVEAINVKISTGANHIFPYGEYIKSSDICGLVNLSIRPTLFVTILFSCFEL